MASTPKPAFYAVAFILIVGLVSLALYRFKATVTSRPATSASAFTQQELDALSKKKAEADDSVGITTAKEYAYVPAQRLPDVKGVSSYKSLKDGVVKFAINVWAGWAPIIYANEGFKPGKVWRTPDGKEFKIELVLMDDPVHMRDAYAAGETHIGWATVDMLPLLVESLQKDSRVMPRVFQQIDWSNGGDGIVVREDIKTTAELRGKTVVLAQNSPSQFFLLNALINAGVQPSEVKFKFTQDAFQAAAAFNADKSISGCVSWAPDIYNLSKVKGNKMLVTTATANKLIADIWFARADFAKDKPQVVEAIVRGIFDAMVQLKEQPNKIKVSKWMSAGFSIPEADTLGMLGDAHWTNFAENKDFFLNENNPTNFERTYGNAQFVYTRIRTIDSKVAFDQLVDFTVLQRLGKEPKYASQKNEYQIQFAPTSAASIQAESPEILTKTVVIHFFPNSWDLKKTISKDVDGKPKSVLYDPNVDFIVEEVGKLAGQYGAARIVVEGHTDASMRNEVDPGVVKDLSLNRANAVREALLRKFPTLQVNQFATNGLGWDRTVDEANHAKNRRVEIKVYPAEAPQP